VASLPIVEDLKVLEDGVGQLEPRVPPLPVQQFDLHPRPERAWRITSPDGSQSTVAARPALAADDAACVGEGLVQELGPTRLRELETFGTQPWHMLGFGLGLNQGPFPLNRAESETIEDVVAACAPDHWKLMLALTITEGADQIGEESARCVSEQLDDQTARSILVAELDRAYDDPSDPDAVPFSDVIQPLIAVFDECLTTMERSALDFN
jgi:hypothetical protein